jgi:hypothetical protein
VKENMNHSIAKQLRLLPYNDMMELAVLVEKYLANRSQSQTISAPLIAGILAQLPVEGVTEAIAQDEQILKEIFRRKRSINITRANAGWEIDIPSLPGSQVFGTELRPMFGTQLDQVITFHVLNKK